MLGKGWRLVALWLLLVGGPSCDSSNQAADQPATAPFAVRDGADKLIFLWTQDGEVHTTSRIAEVPDKVRSKVRVQSMAVSPETQSSESWVYVTDLTAQKPDGTYPVDTVRREQWESLSGLYPADEPSTEVVLYSAAWCGACRAAREYLTARGTTFAEKDIEKDPGAKDEMKGKLEEAGQPFTGIPVLDIDGTLIRGFDRPRIEGLLAAK